jgi:hypothetical protein
MNRLSWTLCALVSISTAISAMTSACAASIDSNPSERCSSGEPCSAGRSCERGFCVFVTGTDASAEDAPPAVVDLGRDLGIRVDSGQRDLGFDSGARDLGFDSGLLPPCTGGRDRCGLLCVKLDDTFLHCGACDVACQSGERCKHAKCERD